MGDPEPNLLHLLDLAYRRLDALLMARLTRGGFPDLRPAHSQVFGAIAAEGSRVGEMAEQAGMTQQSMSELVDALEQLGYLERRADPRDRRARLVTLTARGWECIRLAVATIDELERGWAEAMGVNRHHALRAGLHRIATHTDSEL